MPLLDSNITKILIDPEIRKLLNRLTTPNKRVNTQNLGTLAYALAGKTEGPAVLKLIYNNIPDLLTYVNEIPAYAFYSCDWLTTLVIPDNITRIGVAAFHGCTKLHDITLSKNLYEIKENAFYVCTSLEDIFIPKSVEVIKSEAFHGCTSLKSIVFETNSNCRILKERMFENCRVLNTVVLPNSLTDISDYLFSSCSHLENITLPSSLKTIGKYAFFNCASLEHITFNNGLEEIKQHAFSSCAKLKEIVIPESVTLIDAEAFRNCLTLQEVIIEGNKDLRLGWCAFAYCKGLVKVQITKDIYAIEDGAFYECDILKELLLPKAPCSLHTLKVYDLPDSLISLDIPMAFDANKFAASNLADHQNAKIISQYNFPITFTNQSFNNGADLVVTALSTLKKANVPTLYTIGQPSRWNVLTYAKKKDGRNKIDLCIRSIDGGGPGCEHIFFDSIQKAQTFIDKLNATGRVANSGITSRSLDYGDIYTARLRQTDYISNFTEVNTIAGPCLVQSYNAEMYVDPNAIIKEYVF